MEQALPPSEGVMVGVAPAPPAPPTSSSSSDFRPTSPASSSSSHHHHHHRHSLFDYSFPNGDAAAAASNAGDIPHGNGANANSAKLPTSPMPTTMAQHQEFGSSQMQVSSTVQY